MASKSYSDFLLMRITSYQKELDSKEKRIRFLRLQLYELGASVGILFALLGFVAWQLVKTGAV